ncbi:hypothetical protein ACFQX7_26850 [Luedemannella flava]
MLVSRLMAWLLTNGLGPEQVTVDCGIDVGGGRVPDLSVWAAGKPPRRARSSYAGLDGLLLVVEVVSAGSRSSTGSSRRTSTPRPASPGTGSSNATPPTP